MEFGAPAWFKALLCITRWLQARDEFYCCKETWVWKQWRSGKRYFFSTMSIRCIFITLQKRLSAFLLLLIIYQAVFTSTVVASESEWWSRFLVVTFLLCGWLAWIGYLSRKLAILTQWRQRIEKKNSFQIISSCAITIIIGIIAVMNLYKALHASMDSYTLHIHTFFASGCWAGEAMRKWICRLRNHNQNCELLLSKNLFWPRSGYCNVHNFVGGRWQVRPAKGYFIKWFYTQYRKEIVSHCYKCVSFSFF